MRPRRLLFGMAVFCLAAIALVPLSGPLARVRAGDPQPNTYSSIDDYYIARGWTDGYASTPLVVKPRVRPAVDMPYKVQLPAILEGPAPKETRALWVTRWDFRDTPDEGRRDIGTIADKAAYAHFNTILFQVRGAADAVYASQIEPWWATSSHPLGQDPGWDPLATMIEQAHAKGLEVHAWINVCPAWYSATIPSPSVVPLPMLLDFNARYGNEWIQWGKPTSRSTPAPMPLRPANYLCASPAHPAVVDRIIAVCRDLLTRYDLDGLHFDYIRYDDYIYSYDPLSERAYAAALAAEPGLARAEWQRRQINGLLERVRREVLPLRPSARLSAAVWPCYIYQDSWGWPGWNINHDGYHGYYQDSQGWAQRGLVDGVMPMLYSVSFHDYPERFKAMVHDYVEGSRPGGVIAGIVGDYTSFQEIAWRIDTARANGARGQAILSYRVLAWQEKQGYDYWTALRETRYQRVAVPDWP